MRIPLEHFCRIPVSALSSRQNPFFQQQQNQQQQQQQQHQKHGGENSVGSAPTSPEMRRRGNKISVVASTGSLEALNSAQIDAEYDDVDGPMEQPQSLAVTSCYGNDEDSDVGNSGPVSLPIAAFGRRRKKEKAK